MLNANNTVREFAVQVPNAARLFEKLGIDYCCGGGKSLSDACRTAQVEVEEVLRNLKETTEPDSAAATSDWNEASLTDLSNHIVAKHHAYVKLELPRLTQLLEKVAGKHAEKHLELHTIKHLFRSLSSELNSHLMKEETILFPYIAELERTMRASGRVRPPMFGTVKNPIHMMELEHDSAGDALKEIRKASNGLSVPEDGCFSFRTLYQGLQEFEADLHQHVHLENNILFPRAIELESRSR
jgi:regulator of cell morphogenesis and NO signaling